MSNHSSQDVTEKKKKDVWQEAGSEFYQESYPSGSGQNEPGNHRKSSRQNIPLPSQTARRNSYAYSRRRNTNNTTYGRTGTVNAYTYTSTGIGTATVTHEVHVSVLPDLADMTIPNERKRWDELRKIKTMPISMAAKRELKAQLTTIPMLKLKGWKRLRWHQQRFIEAFGTAWTKGVRNSEFMKRSLLNIDSRCGTSIVKVFQFTKWTAFLNFWIFLLVGTFIILPGILGVERDVQDVNGTCPLDFNNTIQFNTSSNWDSESMTREKQLADCCTASYNLQISNIPERDSLGRAVIELLLDSKAMAMQYSPLVYGFYPSQEVSLAEVKYRYAEAYGVLPVIVLGLCLVLLVPQIGTGIKELISAREGEFYSYSNLIFSGWDHYTKDEAGAKFKKKILKHEMKVALKTEKRKIESNLRTRKQKWLLWLVRVITNLMVVGVQIGIGAMICYVTQLSIDETVKCVECEEGALNSTSEQIYFRRIGLQLLPATSISLANMGFPVLLQQIGRLEKYSPSTQMKWLLIRSLLARLLSIAFAGYQLFSALYCTKLESTCTFCNSATEQESQMLEKSPCWESVIGEHIYVLLLVDFSIKAIMVFVVGLGRWFLGQYIPLKACSRVGRMKFSIVTHSLDIVYAQFLAWFFYFAPFIPIVVTIYCFLLFYMMKLSVLVNCKAVPNTYRTTRTTTVFVLVRLISLASASVVIGMVLNLQPSRGCGPFREFGSPWETVRRLYSNENTTIYGILTIVTSPAVTIPVAVILFIIGFYYYSVAKANRSMVETLRHLLILESKDKQYLWTAVCERETGTNNCTTIDL